LHNHNHKADSLGSKHLAKDDKAEAETGRATPETYSIKGAPRAKWSPFMPDYDLWVTLKGGNGTWAKRQAQDVWEEQLQKHKEYEDEERRKEAERRRQRAMAAEAERKRREELERYIANHEQRELERRRKFEEQQRLDAERDAEMERQRAEAARWLAKRQPRECKSCKGSGHCPTCSGKGFIFHFYPASTCSMNLYPTASTSRSYGRVNGGCPGCGGSGDETWSNYTPGSGRCKPCGATGMVKAPDGGWPD